MAAKKVSGNIVDIIKEEIYPGTLIISGGKIADIKKDTKPYKAYIIPGFIDSHVHIESSMLTPSEFARAAVSHGTVAALCDPHEIANVLGIDGIDFMIDNSRNTPMKIYFSAPSCVPATSLEPSGDTLGPEKVEELLKRDEIKCLGEVMNFPGVINDDPDIMRKIQSARNLMKVIDGHAPGLRGKDLEKYAAAGISTNHECLTKKEALENIKAGLMVQIRAGSAADILDELLPIIEDNYEHCMFCSDDKHPDDLLKGHINDMVKKSVNYGTDIMKVLRVASMNPVLHYGLDVGLLQKGNSADFLQIDNLKDIKILATYIGGEKAAIDGKTLLKRTAPKIVNNFNSREKVMSDFALPSSEGTINIIVAIDGQLMTERMVASPRVENGCFVSDIERDILKIVVVNRYEDSLPTIGFIKNFGIKKGAIASSVAHDSHNIVAVGVLDEDICRAVNLIIRHKGGISAVSDDKEAILPLPIAGIMSDDNYFNVAEKYSAMDRTAKSMGSQLKAPFMTLSFMSLPVIPKIKLTSRGLFDGEAFKYIDVFQH